MHPQFRHFEVPDDSNQTRSSQSGAAAWLAELEDLTATMDTVTNGRSSMPPFGTTLTPDQIRDISAYVIQVLAK